MKHFKNFGWFFSIFSCYFFVIFARNNSSSIIDVENGEALSSSLLQSGDFPSNDVIDSSTLVAGDRQSIQFPANPINTDVASVNVLPHMQNVSIVEHHDDPTQNTATGVVNDVDVLEHVSIENMSLLPAQHQDDDEAINVHNSYFDSKRQVISLSSNTSLKMRSHSLETPAKSATLKRLPTDSLLDDNDATIQTTELSLLNGLWKNIILFSIGCFLPVFKLIHLAYKTLVDVRRKIGDYHSYLSARNRMEKIRREKKAAAKNKVAFKAEEENALGIISKENVVFKRPPLLMLSPIVLWLEISSYIMMTMTCISYLIYISEWSVLSRNSAFTVFMTTFIGTLLVIGCAIVFFLIGASLDLIEFHKRDAYFSKWVHDDIQENASDDDFSESRKILSRDRFCYFRSIHPILIFITCALPIVTAYFLANRYVLSVFDELPVDGAHWLLPQSWFALIGGPKGAIFTALVYSLMGFSFMMLVLLVIVLYIVIDVYRQRHFSHVLVGDNTEWQAAGRLGIFSTTATAFHMVLFGGLLSYIDAEEGTPLGLLRFNDALKIAFSGTAAVALFFQSLCQKDANHRRNDYTLLNEEASDLENNQPTGLISSKVDANATPLLRRNVVEDAERPKGIQEGAGKDLPSTKLPASQPSPKPAAALPADQPSKQNKDVYEKALIIVEELESWLANFSEKYAIFLGDIEPLDSFLKVDNVIKQRESDFWESLVIPLREAENAVMSIRDIGEFIGKSVELNVRVTRARALLIDQFNIVMDEICAKGYVTVFERMIDNYCSRPLTSGEISQLINGMLPDVEEVRGEEKEAKAKARAKAKAALKKDSFSHLEFMLEKVVDKVVDESLKSQLIQRANEAANRFLDYMVVAIEKTLTEEMLKPTDNLETLLSRIETTLYCLVLNQNHAKRRGIIVNLEYPFLYAFLVEEDVGNLEKSFDQHGILADNASNLQAVNKELGALKDALEEAEQKKRETDKAMEDQLMNNDELAKILLELAKIRSRMHEFCIRYHKKTREARMLLGKANKDDQSMLQLSWELGKDMIELQQGFKSAQDHMKQCTENLDPKEITLITARAFVVAASEAAQTAQDTYMRILAELTEKINSLKPELVFPGKPAEDNLEIEDEDKEGEGEGKDEEEEEEEVNEDDDLIEVHV